MKVLVVDDSRTMRRIIIKGLRELGYEDVLEASNGKEGLAQLAGGEVELVITDWNMPGINGLEMARKIRAGEAPNKDVPILMVTTNAAHGDVVEALKVGVNNFLGKPMTTDMLKEKIQFVMAST
ncbi:MAG: response regulator [Acidobacteriota bacterium]|nr:response regulator [Acidobacteriota bacterium]